MAGGADITASVDQSSLVAILAKVGEIKDKIDAATYEATKKSAEYLQSRAVHNFEGGHPYGFHHVGGAAPNTVSGFLQRSIIYKPITGAAGVYTTHEGPTAIYARVIELGAHITPTEKKYLSWFDAQYGVQRYEKEVTIPPHPYFIPAYRSLAERMDGIFYTALSTALEV